MTADHCVCISFCIDCSSDAEQISRKAGFPLVSIIMQNCAVEDVCIVNPDPAMQYKPFLKVRNGSEYLVFP